MDVTGQWQMIQGDLILTANISPVEPDGSFKGVVTWNNGNSIGGGKGYIRDGIFVFRVSWSNNSEGIYTGVPDAQGRLVGSTFNVFNPSQISTWSSDRSVV
ncbi:MAG: hypothetical protein CV088_01045 [Nitrospira sp. LK70]|nr:hypothetical protein [Nitrospira sp. LK70]